MQARTIPNGAGQPHIVCICNARASPTPFWIKGGFRATRKQLSYATDFSSLLCSLFLRTASHSDPKCNARSNISKRVQLLHKNYIREAKYLGGPNLTYVTDL